MKTNSGILEGTYRIVSSTGDPLNDIVLKEENGVLVFYEGDGITLLEVNYIPGTVNSNNTVLRRTDIGSYVSFGQQVVQLPVFIVDVTHYITISTTYPTYTQANTDNAVLEYSLLKAGLGANLKASFFSHWTGTTGHNYWRKVEAVPVGGGSPIVLLEETFTATTGEDKYFQDDISTSIANLDDGTDYFIYLYGAEESGSLFVHHGELFIYHSGLED